MANLLAPASQQTNLLGMITNVVIVFLTIITFFIIKRERNKKNKFIFVNFFLFFASASITPIVLLGGNLFVRIEPFINFYIYQYHTSVSFFFLTFAIAYIVFDTLFREFLTHAKYGLSILIVGLYFGYYFHPILHNPQLLYSTPEVRDFGLVANAVDQLREQKIANPTPEEVAAITRLPVWSNGEQIGTLYDAANLKRIRNVFPYLAGENFALLIYKPLWLNITFMNVFCIVFILLFFGYQYRKDPPQGAYIEKIVFLFLPYCSLEILHNYGYVRSIEFEGYLQLHDVGLYLTLANLIFLLIFFSLRLSFILSIKGEFYEQELVSDSEHISRWRDSIDNLIIRHFLNPQTLHGRLFAPRETKSKA